MNVKKLVPATMILALMALTGCASETGSKSAATAGNNRPAEAADADEAAAEDAPVEEPVEEEPEPEDMELAFGETFTYENGISLRIDKGVPYKPTECASGGEQAAAVLAFKVTLVNGSKERFDPNLFTTTLQSANVEGDAVYDSADCSDSKGIEMGGSPSTTLLPGREAVFTIGYGVQDPADLVLEAAPGFEYENVIYFTGS